MSQLDFFQVKFELLSLRKASFDSLATQHMVHAGCFSMSIIHQTLMWTTGPLTYAQMLMRADVHRGSIDTERESAVKFSSGRKIPCCTRESNLHQWHAGLALYQLNYIPAPLPLHGRGRRRVYSKVTSDSLLNFNTYTISFPIKQLRKCLTGTHFFFFSR